jgi:hypothetical protein
MKHVKEFIAFTYQAFKLEIDHRETGYFWFQAFRQLLFFAHAEQFVASLGVPFLLPR